MFLAFRVRLIWLMVPFAIGILMGSSWAFSIKGCGGRAVPTRQLTAITQPQITPVYRLPQEVPR